MQNDPFVGPREVCRAVLIGINFEIAVPHWITAIVETQGNCADEFSRVAVGDCDSIRPDAARGLRFGVDWQALKGRSLRIDVAAHLERGLLVAGIEWRAKYEFKLFNCLGFRDLRHKQSKHNRDRQRQCDEGQRTSLAQVQLFQAFLVGHSFPP